MFVTVILLSCFTAFSSSCEYVAKIDKLAGCQKGAVEVVKFTDISLKLEDKTCAPKLTGCVHAVKDIKSANVKYKIFKNRMQLLTGSRQACGYKDGDFELTCPVAKGFKHCVKNKNLNVKGIKGILNLAVGNVRGVADVVTPDGTYCVELLASVKRK